MSEDQVLELLEEKNTHSQSSVHSNNYKLSLEANPDLLEVSCSQIQAPACSSKSVSHHPHPHPTQFKDFDLSMPNSKVKFFRGSPSKPFHSLQQEGESSFDDPLSSNPLNKN